MDYRIEQLLKVMKMLDDSAAKMPMPELNQDAVKEGLRLSKLTCAQPEFVFATPWMKNLLVICGDVKQTQDSETGEWHTDHLRTGSESKAVNLVNQWVEAALLKFNGKKRDSYDESLPVGDPEHYNTDCWLGWKPKVWDIQPGQAEERAEVFRMYTRQDTNFSVQKMIQEIQKSRSLQKALLVTLETLPEVRASREVSEISDPFMSKGTGVSYPDYKNDRTPVKGRDITYGKYEIELTQKAANKGLDSLVRFAYDNNVYTGYPRNQRGKGRALEAESRRTNLVVNLLNSPEMEEWKRSPILGTAFQNEQGIKDALVKKAEWIENHSDQYCGRNEDTSGWDRSVGAGWITLSGALRYLRANGSYSKKLVEVRHNCARKAYFIDGPNNRVSTLYGRTPSGYDDTTLLNSTIHRALSNAALISIDPHFTENVIYPTHYEYEDIVGDDICTIFPKGAEAVRKFRKFYADHGYTIHSDEKSIFGVMFIQYRVLKKEGKWIMAYNWPRVFRSMLSKETAKQLGVGGWILSGWQQLGKLLEYPEMCQIPLNFICACDQYKLGLFMPVSEIKSMIEEEDQNRVKKEAKDRAKKLTRILTTAERLSNNPTLPGVKTINGKSEIDWDYFSDVQSKLKPLYDEQFLSKLGFKNPDLSKVH